MTDTKSISPERAAINNYGGAEALRLKALYEKEAAKGGGFTAARDAIKSDALRLLAEIGAPSAMIRMFSVMMGRVKQEPRYSAEFKWLEYVLNYEARSLNYDFEKARSQTKQNREVKSTEIRDAIMDEYQEKKGCTDPDNVYRRVNDIRTQPWYPDVLAGHCIYLMDYDYDDPKTV